MKLLKICWYTIMAASFFAGRITGRREFFLLLFIMGFVVLFSLSLNLWTARSFCYTNEVDKKVCVKGDQTFMRVAITNDKQFPFPLIYITMIPIARSRVAYERFSLLPSSRIIFTVPLSCPYRGIHNTVITTLEINDSFGLVKTNFNMLDLPYYRHIEVKVYPQLTELGALPASGGDSKNIGNAGMWSTGQGESYAGLRPFRPGDPFKRVHRAVSLRRRELYVRTYDQPLETSVQIILDTIAEYATEEDGLYLSDLVCQCAAAIARYSLKTGYRVIYRDSGLASAMELKTVKDFPKLYDSLAGLRFDADSSSADSDGADNGGVDSGGADSSCVDSGCVDNGGADSGCTDNSDADSNGADNGCAAAWFSQDAARQFSGARAVYFISARGNNGIRKALASFDKAKMDIKLIAARLRTSNSSAAESRIPTIPGVQTISIKVGDDVAAVLSV